MLLKLEGFEPTETKIVDDGPHRSIRMTSLVCYPTKFDSFISLEINSSGS